MELTQLGNCFSHSSSLKNILTLKRSFIFICSNLGIGLFSHKIRLEGTCYFPLCQLKLLNSLCQTKIRWTTLFCFPHSKFRCAPSWSLFRLFPQGALISQPLILLQILIHLPSSVSFAWLLLRLEGRNCDEWGNILSIKRRKRCTEHP